MMWSTSYSPDELRDSSPGGGSGALRVGMNLDSRLVLLRISSGTELVAIRVLNLSLMVSGSPLAS